MAPSYYVIELSARWLTVLLVALALVMVLAFAFGYGAAWSVQAGGRVPPTASVAALTTVPPSPTETVVLPPSPRATSTQPPATATPRPVSTAPPRSTPTAVADGRWVQVVAASTPQNVRETRNRLVDLGFPLENQQVDTATVAGGKVLYKVRVGPFPDRESAERVVRRMQASGFPDAWMVME